MSFYTQVSANVNIVQTGREKLVQWANNNNLTVPIGKSFNNFLIVFKATVKKCAIEQGLLLQVEPDQILSLIVELERKIDNDFTAYNESTLLGDLINYTNFYILEIPTRIKALAKQVKVDNTSRLILKKAESTVQQEIQEIKVQTNEAFVKQLKKIDAILKLEEILKKPRSEISENEIELQLKAEEKTKLDAEEKAREKEFEILIAQEEEEKEKQAKQATSKKKNKQKVQQISKKKEQEIDVPKIAADDVKMENTSNSRQKREKYLRQLISRKSIAEHPRVSKRWATSSIEEIKKFVDRDANNNEITRYAKLSDTEIKKARFFHLLSGTEKIFANDIDKKIYTFITERGLGMIGMLECPNDDGTTSIYHGAVYCGIGKDGKEEKEDKNDYLFHRCFEVMSLNRIVDALQYLPEQITDSPLQDNQGWRNKNKYSFDIKDDGTIIISYEGFGHRLSIYPLRRDLLLSTYPELYK